MSLKKNHCRFCGDTHQISKEAQGGYCYRCLMGLNKGFLHNLLKEVEGRKISGEEFWKRYKEGNKK